jgi:hypothetical protein
LAILLRVTGGDDAAGFAPSFVEKPKIIPNADGSLITMKCKCRAKPKPSVAWFKGTTTVTETSKIKIVCVDLGEDIYELSMEITVRNLHFDLSASNLACNCAMHAKLFYFYTAHFN